MSTQLLDAPFLPENQNTLNIIGKFGIVEEDILNDHSISGFQKPVITIWSLFE